MAKKNFNINLDLEAKYSNVAEQFITKPENLQEAEELATVPAPETTEAVEEVATPIDEIKLPAGYRLAREAKTKKTQVAMQPSLFNAVKEVATQQGQSFNEMLHILLREALENYK